MRRRHEYNRFKRCHHGIASRLVGLFVVVAVNGRLSVLCIVRFAVVVNCICLERSLMLSSWPRSSLYDLP